MRLRPRLVPIAPTPGDAQAIETTPFWIGASSTAHLKVYLPGVAERHASITEREDGFYIAPHSAATVVTVNGDRSREANETFLVTLSQLSGASLLDGSARGNIANDD